MYLLSEIHFWSTCDNLLIKSTDFSAFKYYSKKESNDELLWNSKKAYCEKRNITCIPINKRPFKIKDKLKELEEHLLQSKVICSSWNFHNLQILLAKGLIVAINLNAFTNEVTNITFNKLLTTKLQSESICDGVICGDQVVCVTTDGHAFGQGGIWKDGWVIECGTKRRVSYSGDLLCIWGRVNTEHPQPWSPLAKDHERANLLLYRLGFRLPELCAHKKTEGEPIDIIISKIQSKVLISIEQKVSIRGAVSVEVNSLELAINTFKRISVIAVPLQTQVSCCALSNDESRLVLGCIDGSLALLDRNRGSTHIVKSSIIPTFALWHMNNALICISNEKGQLQYFDTALNRINTQLAGEDSTSISILDLSSYFNIQQSVTCIKWGPKQLFVMLEHGPLIHITHLNTAFTFSYLAQQYIKIGKVQKAIALLLSWEWDDQCYRILHQVVAFLLKLPLTQENSQHIQTALSCFHSPPMPLSSDTQYKYGFRIRSLTRRFFHQLVRYKMYETAFLLAVDIGHHDLFMDLYYCAAKIGEREMAAAARAQASSLLSRCSSEASSCSRSSCSQCSDSYSGSSSDDSMLESNGKLCVSQKLLPPASQAYNDNYLTTNFNDINPKTYNPSTYNPDISHIPTKPVFDRFLNYSTGLAQLSGNLPSHNTLPQAPPLPIAPPLPQPALITNRPLSSNIKSPLTDMSFSSFANHPLTEQSYSVPLVNSRFWHSYRNPHLDLNTKPISHALSNNTLQSNYTPSNLASSSSTLVTRSTQSNANTTTHITSSIASTTGTKNKQTKVKFSDTVTAFIVPEVKRPVRPPPPPHITDPQRELADSLPLCHPNEDYLKDFTPVRHNEPDESPVETKIKVVHFGVV